MSADNDSNIVKITTEAQDIGSGSESLSVIIQVGYFKYTKHKYGEGRKFFKMAPLHHHFELSGWHENHVVIRFWIIGIMCALLSLTTFKIQ